jgi:hypothetical protein
MKHKILFVTITWSCFTAAFAAEAQQPGNNMLPRQIASQPQKAPKSQQTVAILLPTESLDFLAGLNKDGKLVPESVFPNVQYQGLKAENCFGVRLANGQRLAGESATTGYGYTGTLTEQNPDGTFGKEQTFRLAGFMYSEFPFSIEGQQLAAGPYVLEVFTNSLRLVGNDDDHKIFVGGRFVPGSKTTKLPAKVPIPDDFVAKNASKNPQYSVTAKGEGVVLRLLGNEWRLTPR